MGSTGLPEAKANAVLANVKAAVLEEQQIVSFKWIAREYGLSAAQARRLLDQFASGAQLKDKVKRVHLLSGWTKQREHLVQLVPEHRLQEEESALQKVTSRFIYSIQPCVLQDPSALWSAEYTQTNALFSEPGDVQNSLRDNRMSNITCSSVQRQAFSQPGSGPQPSGVKAEDNHSHRGSGPLVGKPSSTGSIGISLGGGSKSSKKPVGISLNSKSPTKPKKKNILASGATQGGSKSAKGVGISLDGKKKTKAASIGLSLDSSKAEKKDKEREEEKHTEKKRAVIAEESESDEEEMAINDQSRKGKKSAAAGGMVVLSEDDESENEEELMADPEPEPELVADMEVDVENHTTTTTTVGNGKNNKDVRSTSSARTGGLSLSSSKTKRQKLYRTIINEKGEEVTEEYWEEEGKGEDKAQGQAETTAGPPKQSIGIENKNPNPPKSNKPKASQKSSSKAKGASKKQMGIASFFARKTS